MHMARNVVRKFLSVLIYKRRILLTEKFVIFSFFLLLSFAIWYLNKLGGDYLIDLKVPLRVSYSETDKVLIDEGIIPLKIQVKTKGYTVLRFKLRRSISPAQIDISSYKLFHYKGEPDRYFILSSAIRSSLSLQLPASVKIENIVPDTLFFRFSAAYSKVVPVRGSADFTFEPQHMQVGTVNIKPDSVKISGPKSIIAAKQFVITEPIRARDLKAPFSGVIPLKEENNVVFSISEVRYSVDVAKYTDEKFRLPIHLECDSGKVSGALLIPSSAEVSFRVALKDYGKVQPSSFLLMARKRSRDISNLVKVELDSFPDFISRVRISPEFVEIYSQKK